MVASSLSEVQMAGRPAATRTVDADLSLAARCDATVMFIGDAEAGTEAAARWIHQRSARRAGPFVVVNCDGVPDASLESALFGHACGNPTNGTLFLNDIGALSRRSQDALVRLLEGRSNVRLVTAATRALPDHVAAGAFRSDLYFRLNIIRIDIPPLPQGLTDDGQRAVRRAAAPATPGNPLAAAPRS